MALATLVYRFNRAPQPRPHVGRVIQEVLPLVRIIFQPGPRGSTTFSSVAGRAGSHEISRRVVTAFDKRLNVVERQLAVGEYSCTVDTTIGIAAEDIRALVFARL